MKKRKYPPFRATEFSGFTLLEVMVATFISSMIMVGLVGSYSSSVALSVDQRVRIETVLQAQAMLQSIGAEIRSLGNGVPFDQANFQISEDTLSDQTVSQPILVTSATSRHISFRLNETGDVLLLTQDFNPALSLQIHLTDCTNLDVNDPIYLSNSVVSGEDGLYGVISAVDTAGKTVTIQAGYVASPTATFSMGSTLEEVPVVQYDSPISGSGITRDSGFGPVLMAANSTLELTYLNESGTAMTLPLTEDDLINSLRSIKVRITHTSADKLKDGTHFVAAVEQVFGIRNLNFVF